MKFKVGDIVRVEGSKKDSPTYEIIKVRETLNFDLYDIKQVNYAGIGLKVYTEVTEDILELVKAVKPPEPGFFD